MRNIIGESKSDLASRWADGVGNLSHSTSDSPPLYRGIGFKEDKICFYVALDDGATYHKGKDERRRILDKMGEGGHLLLLGWAKFLDQKVSLDVQSLCTVNWRLEHCGAFCGKPR